MSISDTILNSFIEKTSEAGLEPLAKEQATITSNTFAVWHHTSAMVDLVLNRPAPTTRAMEAEARTSLQRLP